MKIIQIYHHATLWVHTAELWKKKKPDGMTLQQAESMMLATPTSCVQFPSNKQTDKMPFECTFSHLG